MAEFTEVMRQARRMCEAFRDGHCSECPIGNAKVLECGITVMSEMDCEETERRVMQWAAEHPEPVYPTWSEWQNRMFPDAHRDATPCQFGSMDRFNCAKKTCYECMEQQIPADIAEKLGIKPITSDKHVPAHDGCDKCKYEHMSCNDEPCKRCRGNIGEPAPDLWEDG